jgi:hypothetical protein
LIKPFERSTPCIGYDSAPTTCSNRFQDLVYSLCFAAPRGTRKKEGLGLSLRINGRTTCAIAEIAAGTEAERMAVIRTLQLALSVDDIGKNIARHFAPESV